MRKNAIMSSPDRANQEKKDSVGSCAGVACYGKTLRRSRVEQIRSCAGVACYGKTLRLRRMTKWTLLRTILRRIIKMNM